MNNRVYWFVLLLALFAGFHRAAAQGTTAFTYQGQLRDSGTNANGAYTMIFKLYDSSSGDNQIATGITNTPTLFNGLFTVNLDFGAAAFNGSARWLDITISNNFVIQTLSPRVQVLPAPYAQFAAIAATVTNGAIMNAQLAANAIATTNIQNGAVTNANLTANAVNATNIAGGQVVKSLNGLTDAISLSAGNNVGLLTNGGIVQISSFVPNIQLFRSSGTFIVPTNVTRIMVEMWGAGGGGGAGNASGGTIGGGGGAGAYAVNVFTVTPGANYSVSCGAGGNGGTPGGSSGVSGPGSSFGVLLSAGGGGGGSNATSVGNGTGGSGGNSSGSVGNANVQGGGGDNYGNGGGVWRGGAPELQSGNSASGPGSGGSGGGPGNGVTASPGEQGNSGVVIVYY